MINRRVNREIHAVPIGPLDRLHHETLNLDSKDYHQLTDTAILSHYSRLGYLHSKPLEYLTSLTLLDLPDGGTLLDAAGGGAAEFSRAVNELRRGKINLLCQDAVDHLLAASTPNLTYIGGSIDTIPIADSSVDGVTCHHSIEHFQSDLDVRFLQESIRVLRPGGKLIVVPLFITDMYAEIWNRHPSGQFDPAATTVVDHTAAFAGWGPYEGFARTYSLEAFERRVLCSIPDSCSVSVFDVYVDGVEVPDMNHNRHQPLLNGGMRVLQVVKG
jgi:SAM-dependent methyltransferase